jgi:hypothetical protein
VTLSNLILSLGGVFLLRLQQFLGSAVQQIAESEILEASLIVVVFLTPVHNVKLRGVDIKVCSYSLDDLRVSIFG